MTVDLDGPFMDVSPLCRVHKKQFEDWQGTDDAQASIALVQKLTGKPVNSLINSTHGPHGSIFVHRYLWYEFAMWCSDECKEWVWRA